MARSRARARLNCSSQGQRRGRCRVNRRAERVRRDGCTDKNSGVYQGQGPTAVWRGEPPGPGPADAPEQCPSRRSPLSSRWHQPAISAISGAGSEQFPVEDKPGRGGHHSGCGGVGEDECLVITDGHWPEGKASAPPPAGPGPPPPGSRLGPRSPACGDGLGGPSGSAPLSRDAWPLSQLAHRAVDPGLPHVQALHPGPGRDSPASHPLHTGRSAPCGCGSWVWVPMALPSRTQLLGIRVAQTLDGLRPDVDMEVLDVLDHHLRGCGSWGRRQFRHDGRHLRPRCWPRWAGAGWPGCGPTGQPE